MKVLIVDDEPDIRAEVVECLGDEGYDWVEAENAEQGEMRIIEDPEIAVVLSDIQMPGRTGIEMIAAAKAALAGADERIIEYVILTGHGGTREAIEALQLGVLDFLTKPLDIDHLLHVVRRAEELVYLKRAQRHHEQGLKADVQAKTVEVRRLLGSLEDAYAESLDCLAVAAEYKDPETGIHIRRIGEYACLVGAELGWPRERLRMIRLAAPLHDAGKIGTPEAVLLKPGKLTPGEVVVMKQHAEIGHRILSRSKHTVMVCAANIAWSHHERWDGSGYPRGLKASEIPIEARITTLVDVYDALRSKRPYKPGFDHAKASSIIVDGDGRTDPSHFDPELLDIFRTRCDDFDAIFRRLTG